MKNLILVALTLIGLQNNTYGSEKEIYSLVLGHTDMAFTVKHMLISKTRGVFKDFSGQLEVDEKSKVAKNISVIIKADSIFTNDEKRDGHLKNEDFFDVKTYPEITFKLNELKYKENSKSKTTGQLTIRGITKTIPLEIEFNGFKTSPFDNKKYGGFNLKAQINRKDFGMVFNKTMDQGGVAIANEVDIEISGEFAKNN